MPASRLPYAIVLQILLEIGEVFNDPVVDHGKACRHLSSAGAHSGPSARRVWPSRLADPGNV